MIAPGTGRPEAANPGHDRLGFNVSGAVEASTNADLAAFEHCRQHGSFAVESTVGIS